MFLKKIVTCLILTTVFTCKIEIQAKMPSLDSLSLEEKIGQMLFVHFYGTSLNEEAHQLIEQIHVGGFIYYNWSNPFKTRQEVKALNSSLQKQAKNSHHDIPLFIAVDQEGGLVIRLKEGFTLFPSQQDIATNYTPDYALASAYITGQELLAVGVNTNFSPVVDVNNNPFNPVIGSRAFSHNPLTVTAFAKEALLGYRAAGILATLKHFPGHGDVTVDSHIALPVVDKSLEELGSCELYPYKELHSYADMIMTAHLLIPSLDQTHCATLSKSILQGLLRESLGFNGLIISDSLIMDGLIKQTHSIEEAAILAIEAGCNMLILGGKLLHKQCDNELTVQDVKKIHQTLINAVITGRLSEQLVDYSVQKILEIKEKYKF
jgi:beta-N-acetylhexosaminidase